MEIREIAEGVFLHTSYKELPGYGYFPSNGLIVIDQKNAYIVDTPWPEGDTEKLVKWISESGYSLKASLSTHFHDDRSSGIGYLNSLKVKTYASTATNELLEANGMAKASLGFDGPEFSLGSDLIQAFYPGAGHTTDNLVVWLPNSNILFGGCLIRSMETTSLGNIEDASVADWPDTIKNVMDEYQSQEISIVVPGHGSIGGSELLAHTLETALKQQ